MGFLLKEEKDALLAEFNLLREEILDRDYKTWVINAILIIGSIIAAFTPSVESFPTASVSIALVLSALAIHATSERVNGIAYDRIEVIAKQLKIAGPNLMYKSRISGQWWYIARKNVAYALFTVLISIYLFLIFANLYIFGIAIVVGFLLIAFKEQSNLRERNLKNYNPQI